MKLLILTILLVLCFEGNPLVNILTNFDYSLFSVQCNDYCEHGSLRLVDGGTYYGRLEICINFVWGTVCDDSFNTNDAKVVCRQLGYEVDGGQSENKNITTYISIFNSCDILSKCTLWTR